MTTSCPACGSHLRFGDCCPSCGPVDLDLDFTNGAKGPRTQQEICLIVAECLNRLKARRRELEERLANTYSYSHDGKGPLDDILSKGLGRVMDAIQRLEQNSHQAPKCVTCDRPIEVAVLEAHPESELCQKCKLQLRREG